MAFSGRLKLGFFLVAVVSITSFASTIRAGSSDIVLCANNKTGVLRYSKSGKCNNRLESVLTINPNGEAGPAGPAGPVGQTGASGSDGGNGANGNTGPQGPAGLSWKWIDANGNQIGDFIDYFYPKFMFNGMIYQFNPQLSDNYASNHGNFIFIDSACTTPKGSPSFLNSQQAVFTTSGNDPNGAPRVWWRATGVTGTHAGGDTFYRFNDISGGTCVPYTVQNAPTSDFYRGTKYYEVAVYSGSPPAYTAPVLLSRN